MKIENVNLEELQSVVAGLRANDEAADSSVPDEWGRSDETVEQFAGLFDFLYDRWFRTEVTGLANIPDGGALLAANHAGALPPDATQIIWALRRGLGRDLYMLGDDMLARFPVFGRVFRRLGGVEANPETGRALLGEQGKLGLVFPEGTKGSAKHVSDRYQLRRFGRGGFVRLAMDAGVPIVPVAVVGAEEAMPIVANVPAVAKLFNMPYAPITPWIWLPAKFQIRFLTPIDVADGPTDDHTVQLHTERIRAVVQDALLDMVAKRRRVFRG